MTTATKPNATKPTPPQVLTLAVAYIRMSSSKQEASPERQKMEILSLALRGGYQITHWYQDLGLTGTESLNRPEFLRMLADAKKGNFRAILMYEQSRFSRDDLFDVMPHWKVLKQARVDIVTCQRGKLNFGDLGGMITAMVDQHGAHDESRKIGERVASGKRHLISQGKRPFGLTPFAFDKQLIDEAGQVVRQVHFRDKFVKPRTWTLRMVPSADVVAVDAVRWSFAQARQGLSIRSIAKHLNAQ